MNIGVLGSIAVDFIPGGAIDHPSKCNMLDEAPINIPSVQPSPQKDAEQCFSS